MGPGAKTGRPSLTACLQGVSLGTGPGGRRRLAPFAGAGQPRGTLARRRLNRPLPPVARAARAQSPRGFRALARPPTSRRALVGCLESVSKRHRHVVTASYEHSSISRLIIICAGSMVPDQRGVLCSVACFKRGRRVSPLGERTSLLGEVERTVPV